MLMRTILRVIVLAILGTGISPVAYATDDDSVVKIAVIGATARSGRVIIAQALDAELDLSPAA